MPQGAPADGGVKDAVKYCWVWRRLDAPYPRTPGYRPAPEENKHNAWYR